ncbi:uncharacterized protein LOC123268075 [Cotesia glomerata]|uniref:Uncharacterized protein n=1 Tax=Cotesia glomerata TaxID=32391 RepID=A0AAV7HU09_COTGL|nr:uncharacterized protein LOC123268075 [Cotesia glomerata]KAH0535620.1 hypothetical protein KQX54_017719 [Cotesia glomerata]
MIKILDIEADTEHVHLKIHVPELIKRHIHTKTVWVYLHSPPKKKKKNNYPKKQNYLNENFNSWSASYEESYNNHQDQGEPPFYDDYREPEDYSASLEEPPPVTKFETGVTGYSYPPQYHQSTHGNDFNGNEDDNDNNSVENSSYERVKYNQGHHHAGKLQSGHLYTDDEYAKFYNNKIEQSPVEQATDAANNNFKFVRSNYLLKLLSDY